MPIRTAQERVGTIVGRKYRLDRILGEGGMGVVYAGHHTRLDRPVAVKFLHPLYANDPSVLSRFFAEARAAAKLEHPNVVDVYDLDQDDDGSVYMVLELLEGESLADRLVRDGRLEVEGALAIVLPLLDALERAHAKGIVHRDLKPDNIFLARDEAGTMVPKLLDFGVAKLLDGQRTHRTATGAVVGTAAYMAPEQAMGDEVGPYTDLWSMGVVLYECLAARFPFDFEEGMAATAMILRIVTDPARPLALSAPGAPAHVARCIDRALSKRPSERWQSAAAMREALEPRAAAAARSEGSTPGRPVLVLAGGALGLAVLVGAWLLGASGPSAPAAGDARPAALQRPPTVEPAEPADPPSEEPLTPDAGLAQGASDATSDEPVTGDAGLTEAASEASRDEPAPPPARAPRRRPHASPHRAPRIGVGDM